MKNTIGKLIEGEVRKHQLSIVDFANKINCQRNNVYNIFERNNIDIKLLAKISDVLHHNFFEDVANDLSLVEIEEETEQEKAKRKAVNQFLDVVPRILTEMGKEAMIVFDNVEAYDVEIPDYVLPNYGISFTVGQSWAQKANFEKDPLFEVKTYTKRDNIAFDFVTNKVYDTHFIDIKLDYKTEEEWKEVLSFVFEKFPNFNFMEYGMRKLY